MSKKLSLEAALDKFARNAQDPFSIEKIVHFVRPLLRKIPTHLESIASKALKQNRWIFFDREQDMYIPRKKYFHQAKFRIVPTQEEIKKGILYPGHRFIPFCSWEIFPVQCKLRLQDGTQIRRKKETAVVQDVIIYHTLLGQESMFSYFLHDNEANAQALYEENPFLEEISLTVFNMKSLYKKYQFQPGDALILTVEDWTQGIFTLEHSSAKCIIEYNISHKTWIQKFDDALLTAFTELGTMSDIYEQLSYAFFVSGQELIKNPCLHIGGFLQRSKQVEITSLGINTVLWRKGESPEEDFLNVSVPHFEMTGNIDSLDSILQDIGVAVREVELQAYMKDELYHQKSSLENVMERCFGNRELIFYDHEQQQEFYKLINKLWKKSKNKYNIFCDKICGPYRSKALEILDANNEWLKSLDEEGVNPENFPKHETLALSQIHVMLMQLLAMLNEGDTQDPPEANLDSMLDEIAFSNQTLIESINHYLHSAQKPHLRALPTEEV